MNTLKISFIIMLGIIILCGAYQLLFSYNLLPFIVSGEDLLSVLLIFTAVLLLFIYIRVEKLQRVLLDFGQSTTLNIGADMLEESEGILLDGSAGKSGFFTAIQRYISRAAMERDVFDRVIVLSVKITNSERASIMVNDSRKEELRIYRTLGWKVNELRHAGELHAKPGEGIAGRVFLDQKQICFNSDTMQEDFEPKTKYTSSSFVSLPLRSGSSVIGVLNLTEKKDVRYTRTELEVLGFIIDTAAMKLQSL